MSQVQKVVLREYHTAVFPPDQLHLQSGGPVERRIHDTKAVEELLDIRVFRLRGILFLLRHHNVVRIRFYRGQVREYDDRGRLVPPVHGCHLVHLLCSQSPLRQLVQQIGLLQANFGVR